MADVPPPGEPALYGIKLAYLIAGAAGGIVRSLSKPGGGLIGLISATVAGMLLAGYLSPVVAVHAARWMASPDLTAASVEGMVGFLLGLSGMTGVEVVIRRVFRRLPSPPSGEGR
ncbi:hypothetical protein [Azorhizobium doebereinerae]|uniref:hypothetical protein n=1 Tax=Azorhizobium doebereinerae TaxID=281091 RepID=UPI0012EBE020|nr:hypothetical protein [Azorhizobium doebereinerae]